MHAFCNSFDEVHTLTSGMDGIIGYINGQICGRWGAFPPDNGKSRVFMFEKYRTSANIRIIK